MNARRWSRSLLCIGTAALVPGAVDPLEGSLVVVAGEARLDLRRGARAAGAERIPLRCSIT